MMGAYTIREMAKEADREVAYRRFVYPKLIQNGKPAPPLERRLAIMEEIADKLRKEADAEEATGRLL